MRNLILSALLLASALQTAVGQIVEGQWTYIVENGGATITASSATGDVTIPSVLGGYAVKRVGQQDSSIFGNYKTSVTSVTIPNSVTSIGDSAFKFCEYLTSITIPNSVTSIGATAFYGCRSLTSITIPNSVTYIEYATFGGCYDLASITIPNSVTSIEDYAFWLCTGLTSIIIPNSVTSIGDYAFMYCSGLTSMTIPSSVTSIGYGAFSGCSGLTAITVDAGNLSYSSTAGVLYNKSQTTLIQCPGGFTSVTIPSSVTSIEDYAFSGCTGLTSVTIPSGVTSIGVRAFSGCSGLTSVTIPSSVTNIGESAFEGCSGLTSVTIPSSVTSIGYGAFSGCSGLTAITVDAGNLSYSSTVGVLYNKSQTTLIQCPGGFTSVTIPSSVTSIGNYAFYGCRSLTSIIIPNSVTSIGDWAFANCDTLSSVYFLGNAPTFEDDPFHESTPTVYYFSGSTGWGGDYAGRPTVLSVRFNLSVICDSTKGTVTETPDLGHYILGTQSILTVTPKAGYLLTAWSGNSTASTTSITLTMDSDKSVTANFAQDSGDNDGDGLTNYQESITYGTNPNVAEITSPVAGLYLATQMQSMAIGDLVLTKNANGSFTLNYDIEQSTNLQNWTPYQAYALPLTGLPTGKAFVRIRVK